MYTDEQREQSIREIRDLLSMDRYFNDTDNVAAAIAAIMEYCALHANNCEGCIFNRSDSIGCCFKPHYINPIPENWIFKSEAVQ